MLVIDCSVTMAWLFEDEKTNKTEEILNLIVSDKSAIVPSLWLLEVINTLLVAERRKRLTTLQVTQFWQTLKTLSIEFDHHISYEHTEPVMHLAKEHNLTSYDAAYLNLAIKNNIPLATLDKKLITSAKICGIEVF